MKPGLAWPLAGIASLAVHGGLFLGLAGLFTPRPPPAQSPVETPFDLSTYRVERSEARPAETAGADLAEQSAGGTALSGGAIPVARAEARAPVSEAARPLAVPGETAVSPREPAAAALSSRPPAAMTEVVAASPTSVDVGRATPVAGAPARPIPVPSAMAVPSAPPVGLVEARAAPVSLRLASLRPEAPVLAASVDGAGAIARPGPVTAQALGETAFQAGAVAASAPEAGPAAETMPAADRLTGRVAGGAPVAAVVAVAEVRPAVVPPGAEAPAGGFEADMAVLREPPSEAVTAALAWSGDAGAGVDPVSLAAIQSFMQAGDVGPGAGDLVRDGIGALLAGVPCSRLQTVFDPATGALEVRGHIPEDGLRAPVLAALQAQVGAAIPVGGDLRVLPRPQCGALAGIAAVGLPQSAAQDTNPRIVGAGAHARVYTFSDGERLRFDLVGPDYPAFFYIDYFDSAGMVLHLQPNDYVPLAGIGAKKELVIGDDDLAITVAPPFGQEIMVAFAASEPLFPALRPIREPAGPYLQALKARVAEARARDPGFQGEWVYFFVETRAQ